MRTNRSIQEYCEVVDSDVSKIKLAIEHIEQARAALNDVNLKHLIFIKSKYLRRRNAVCYADLFISDSKYLLEDDLKCIERSVDTAKWLNELRESSKERKFTQVKQG